MRLTTERLIIRDMALTDLDRFHPLANSEFVLKYLCMYKMNREESLAYIRQMMEKGRDFAIALKDTDEFIGKLHLSDDSLRFDVNSVELAYWIGEPYARQGYMTEALNALIEWLFTEQNYDIITVRVLAPNSASLALMKRLGFTQDSYLRRALNYEGTVYDDVDFSMLKEEYQK